MKGWLIYDQKAAQKNASYIHWFIEEAEKQNIELQLIHREALTIGIVNGEYSVTFHNKKIALPDFAVVRTVEPLLQKFLESCDIYTFNNSAVSYISNHKALTHLELNKLQIPTVPTYFLNRATLSNKPPISYPFVLKEATGRSGQQVYFVRNEAQWQDAISSCKTNDLLIQQANVKLGKDVRIFVIGKKIIGAVLRVNDHDFRANYKLGGNAIPYSLTAREKKMIGKIIEHFDFGLVGIDFLIGKNDELLFNEIEDVVGSRILSETTDINLLKEYVTYIKNIVIKKKDINPYKLYL